MDFGHQDLANKITTRAILSNISNNNRHNYSSTYQISPHNLNPIITLTKNSQQLLFLQIEDRN